MAQDPLGEFDIITRYFSRPARRDDVVLGIGDDAALLQPPPGQVLVAATDTLVEGRHFLTGTPPDALGHQALAVNLSDLAAMGAEPAWAMLSLSLPAPDEPWIAAFAEGLYGLAGRYGVELVGGDTVAGPLVITVQVMGFVPRQDALRRSNARPGDVVYVSGSPGVAAAGLECLRSGRATFDSLDRRVQRFLRAEPRLALGRALRGRATSAMDVSDGLLGDLGKLALASGTGARVYLEQLPVDPSLAVYTRGQAERFVLEGGDDYELLFTLPPSATALEGVIEQEGGCPVHRIGEIAPGGRIECWRDGQFEPFESRGYDHFAR